LDKPVWLFLENIFLGFSFIAALDAVPRAGVQMGVSGLGVNLT